MVKVGLKIIWIGILMAFCLTEYPEDNICSCCGEPIESYEEDPWEGRLDDYCEKCSWNRCDAFPGTCGENYD